MSTLLNCISILHSSIEISWNPDSIQMHDLLEKLMKKDMEITGKWMETILESDSLNSLQVAILLHVCLL